MAQITYTNKVALNENPEIADINKVTDDDMNEIKSVVNTNDGLRGDLSTLTTTDKSSVVSAVNELNSDKASKNEVIISDTQPSASDNKLWINTGEVGNQVSEITNSYSESTGLGYSCNFINGTVLYENANGTNSNVTLNDSAANYRYLEIYYGDGDDDYKLSYKCFNPNGKQILLSMNAPTTNAFYINSSRYTINNNSITFNISVQIQFLPSQAIGNYTTKNDTSYSYIRKVIGYK